MNTIIIAKMSCDDSILKSFRKFGAAEIADMVSAAFSFTPFTVTRTELVCARISERYFSACKKLGYDSSFFREYTVMALCQLSQHANSDFDGIYIPFSGEIYLVSTGLFDMKPVEEGSYDVMLGKTSCNGFERLQKRRFAIECDTKEKTISRWQKFKANMSGEVILDLTGKRILSLTAQNDIGVKIENGNSDEEEEHEPMYFLYNED